ncbi:Glutathione S-transferase 1 [Holothuria leucospilota]|uniref:Glutathione S-transferase 1 n=1 Tax=Holothuria leucospilota TaxID=206669 RepID=A0A9Q0YKQ2_HOLLE|nr:Glutathione S-transferase 1 [Holothuria leucospilota]
MVVVKLTYFGVRGRAEPIRYMLHMEGLEFEDKRISSEEWKELKPTTKFGGLPLLEVNGKVLAQSQAIYRHVANMHGFFPENPWDKATVDSICEKQAEFLLEVQKAAFEKDEKKKEELKQKLINESSKTHLAHLEKCLEENNGGKGWFVGDKISLADVQVFFLLHDQYPALALGEEVGTKTFLEGFDLLKDFVDRFKAEPKVADWLNKRPVSPY